MADVYYWQFYFVSCAFQDYCFKIDSRVLPSSVAYIFKPLVSCFYITNNFVLYLENNGTSGKEAIPY